MVSTEQGALEINGQTYDKLIYEYAKQMSWRKMMRLHWMIWMACSVSVKI